MLIIKTTANGLLIAIIIMTITMLRTNTNINQGSINNNNSHSEKDVIVLSLPVLSQLEENNISKNKGNVKSRVHGSYSAKRNEWHMNVSDIANITTIGPIFVQVNSNVNANNNSLYILSTSNKSSTNMYNINVNNASHVSVQANSTSTKSTDTFGGFSWFVASKKSIRNINSNGNMNYNSDKHGNRINDVSSNILTITLKIIENMNNYSHTSLSNLLTIDMNRNGTYNRNQKNNNTRNINKNKNIKVIHKLINIDCSTISIFCGGGSLPQITIVLQDIILHQQINIIHYTNHISTSIFVLLFQMVIY